jgi:Domain of unknown function (DUF4349)
MRTIRPSLATTAGAFLILSVLLAACASSGATAQRDVGSTGDEANGYTGGEAPAAAATAAPVPAGGVSDPGDGVGAPIDDTRIVRTGTIDLQVRDVPKALQTARDGIRAMGGYIGASQTSNTNDQPVASVTYRIPVDRWEDALDLLRGLNGETTKVVAEQTDAVEVTGAVVDLQARIRNLRASETALQAIAAKAVRVSDVLEVESQLTAVRGDIESMSAQLTDLEDRAAFATLTASFAVPVVAVEVATQDWDPRAVVDEASASLVDLLQALTTAGIWFAIVWLPILLVLGIVSLVTYRVLRRSRIVGPRGGGGGSTPDDPTPTGTPADGAAAAG